MTQKGYVRWIHLYLFEQIPSEYSLIIIIIILIIIIIIIIVIIIIVIIIMIMLILIIIIIMLWQQVIMICKSYFWIISNFIGCELKDVNQWNMLWL